MRKNNRKGFTIVELVIVIAVIAILAGVLIPTFAGIVKKANKNSALQEVRAAYTVYQADALTDEDEATPAAAMYVEYDEDFTVVILNGEVTVYDVEKEATELATAKTDAIQVWLGKTVDGDATLVTTDPAAATTAATTADPAAQA